MMPTATMVRPFQPMLRGGKTRKRKPQRKQQRKQKGGFVPSIGGPFVDAVTKYIAPIALYGLYRFLNGSTRKNGKRSNRSKSRRSARL
jgi:hypothetical protein